MKKFRLRLTIFEKIESEVENIAAFSKNIQAKRRGKMWVESLENRVCRTVHNMATGERVCVNPCEQLWCVTVFAFWHSNLISPLFIVFERNSKEIVKK